MKRIIIIVCSLIFGIIAACIKDISEPIGMIESWTITILFIFISLAILFMLNNLDDVSEVLPEQEEDNE